MENKKILLVMCPFWGHEVPPLGLAYIYSYLKTKGYSPSILDINAELYKLASNENSRYWDLGNIHYIDFFFNNIRSKSYFKKQMDIYAKKILSLDVSAVGFSVNISNLGFTLKLCKMIKKKVPKKTIIFGGPAINLFRHNDLKKHIEDYLSFVDFAIIGNGQKILENILERKYTRQKGIKHPIFIESDYIFNNAELPYPDFSGFNLDLYDRKWLPMLMSHGCIRKCKFCSENFISKNHVSRNARDIFKEVLYDIYNHNIRIFYFCDSLINSNLKQTEEFCDLIIKHKVSIRWQGSAGVLKSMNKRILAKMHQSGCFQLLYGVESFSDNVLHKMGKGYTASTAAKILKLTKESGIKVCIHLVAGFPGETETDFKETVEYIKKIHKYIDRVTTLASCVIDLGSYLYDNLDKYNIILENTEDILKWHTHDKKNTYSMRRKRMKVLSETLTSFNIPTPHIYKISF